VSNYGLSRAAVSRSGPVGDEDRDGTSVGLVFAYALARDRPHTEKQGLA